MISALVSIHCANKPYSATAHRVAATIDLALMLTLLVIATLAFLKRPYLPMGTDEATLMMLGGIGGTLFVLSKNVKSAREWQREDMVRRTGYNSMPSLFDSQTEF